MIECLHICLSRLIFGGLFFAVCAGRTALARDLFPHDAKLGLILGVKLDVGDEVTGNCFWCFNEYWSL